VYFLFGFIVSTTIQLYDYLFFAAAEVNDVRANGELPTEL
jgi:hypothetical protein